MSVTTVQAETSQCLFEFLHMEIVAQLQRDTAPDKKASFVLGGLRTNTHKQPCHVISPGGGSSATREPGSQSRRESGGEDVT